MPNLGTKIPKMGRKSRSPNNRGLRRPIQPAARPTRLADALFSRTRQRTLGLLFGQPERSFFLNELIVAAAAGSGAVQRELARLAESGLVSTTQVGRRRAYQANPAAPLFEELRSIVLKTSGAAEPLKAALAPLARRIRLAFLYGSVAKGAATAGSDLDILVVSDDLGLEELYKAFAPAEQLLARKVNPTLYTTTEFRRRLEKPQGFLSRVLAGERIDLIGSIHELPTAG